MDREFLYHLLLHIGIDDPDDYIDTIPKETMERLISKLTKEEIDEILQSMKKDV